MENTEFEFRGINHLALVCRDMAETVEFWEGREDRLHDRLRYRRTADGWALERLAP